MLFLHQANFPPAACLILCIDELNTDAASAVTTQLERSEKTHWAQSFFSIRPRAATSPLGTSEKDTAKKQK